MLRSSSIRSIVSLMLGMLIVAITAMGCRPQTVSKPVASNTTVSAPVTEMPVDEAVVDKLNAETSAETQSEEGSLEEPNSPKEDEAEEVATETAEPTEPAKPEVPPQKLIVFTTHGPIRVDVRLWIDNEAFDHALESLVDHVIEIADTNKDGTATWEELADQPDLKSGQFGNLSFEDPKERKRLINQYDTNRNGWVDRSEVPRLVSRNRGNSEAFSVRQTSYAAERSRADSSLRQLVDENGDGTIQASEMASASQRVRLHDLDDDEIVTPRELLTATGMSMNDMQGRTNDRRRFFGSQAMFTLDDSTPWEEVLYAIQQNYEHGGPINLNRFPQTNLLNQIDSDQDGRLIRDELKSMLETPAEMVLDVRFGKRDEGVKSLTLVNARDLGDESPNGTQLTDDQEIAVDVGGDWLVFRARDSVDSASAKPQAENLLRIYDGNQNNYLEPDEIPEGAEQTLNFDSADKDDNDMLYVEEIEAYLLQRNWIRRCQIRLQGIDGDDPLLRLIDPNGDKRLSARELNFLEQRLASVDGDDSNAIEFDEIPATLIFEFFRGDQDQTPQPLQFNAMNITLPEMDSATPAWFTGMDYNGDGDISRREFLGTQRQFEELDQDQDGFITVAEIAPPGVAAQEQDVEADDASTEEGSDIEK